MHIWNMMNMKIIKKCSIVIYVKERNINTKSTHKSSNTHIHRKEHGNFVRKHENIKAENDEKKNRDDIKDCRERKTLYLLR